MQDVEILLQRLKETVRTVRKGQTDLHRSARITSLMFTEYIHVTEVLSTITVRLTIGQATTTASATG